MNVNWNEVHPGEIILHGKKPAVFIGLVDIHNTAIDIQYVKDGKQRLFHLMNAFQKDCWNPKKSTNAQSFGRIRHRFRGTVPSLSPLYLLTIKKSCIIKV